MAGLPAAQAARPGAAAPMSRRVAQLDADAARAAARWDGPAAIAALRAAIARDPADAWRPMRLAAVLLSAGDAVAAEAQVRLARARGASPEETRALLAATIWAQGEGARALGELSAGPVDPRFVARAQWVRGQILLARGEIADARIALDAASRRLRGFAPVWIDQARLRQANADPAGAEEAIAYALQLSPRRPQALVIRAEITREQQGLAAAVRHYDEALAVAPRHVGALFGKAAALGDLGRYTAMLRTVRSAMTLSKGDPRGYLLQAIMAARAGDMALSRSLLRRTRGALDDEPATMMLNAIVEMDLRGGSVAADWAERLVALQPDNLNARRVLAAAEWADGEALAARDALAPLAARADADHWTLMLSARAESVLGRPAEADALVARAMLLTRGEASVFGRADPYAVLADRAAAAPLDPRIVIPAIRASLAGGNAAFARAASTRLLARNRTVTEAQLVAGDVAIATGDPDRAVEAFREARRLRANDLTAMRLANAQYLVGDAAGAAATILGGVTANPASLPMNRLTGHFFLDIQRYSEAAQRFAFLRRRIGPDDAMMMRALGQALAGAGDAAGADAALEHAYRLAPANRAIIEAWASLSRATGAGARAAQLEQKLRAMRSGQAGDAAIRSARSRS